MGITVQELHGWHTTGGEAFDLNLVAIERWAAATAQVFFYQSPYR